jgi:ribonuclease P protein component
MEDFSFPKSLHLSGKKQVSLLFSKGKSTIAFPFRLLTLPLERHQTQVLFSVSSRNFKKAVDRNRIKRMMREAYRLNRYRTGSVSAMIAYIYIGKEILPYHVIEEKMISTLSNLSSYVAKN